MTFYIMSHGYGIQIDMAKYHPTISQHTWQMTDNNTPKLSGIPSFLSFLLFFHSLFSYVWYIFFVFVFVFLNLIEFSEFLTHLNITLNSITKITEKMDTLVPLKILKDEILILKNKNTCISSDFSKTFVLHIKNFQKQFMKWISMEIL
jgi:hypothetical protein